MKTEENLYKKTFKNQSSNIIAQKRHSLFKRKQVINQTSTVLFWTLAVLIIAILISVFAYLVVQAIPFIRSDDFGGFFTRFLFSNVWNPAAGEFGILTFIVGSLTTTLIALILSFPLGLSISLLLVFYLPPVLKSLLRTVIDLLAGIPSVIYGFFGVLFFGTFLNFISGGVISSLSVFSAALILTFMTLPTMVVYMNLALESVPNNMVLGSIALGATQMETNFKICVKSSKAGIMGAVIAAFGRAIGEAAAVTLIIGGSVAVIDGVFDGFLFRSGASLTTVLTSFIREAEGTLQAVLFTVGVIILIIATIVNIIALYFQQKIRKQWK